MFFRRKKVSQQDIEKIQEILSEIRNQVSENSKFVDCYFTSSEMFYKEIEKLADGIQSGDRLFLTTIAMHFTNSSSFQEVSIQNGWEEKYFELANRFDEVNNKY